MFYLFIFFLLYKSSKVYLFVYTAASNYKQIKFAPAARCPHISTQPTNYGKMTDCPADFATTQRISNQIKPSFS